MTSSITSIHSQRYARCIQLPKGGVGRSNATSSAAAACAALAPLTYAVPRQPETPRPLAA